MNNPIFSSQNGKLWINAHLVHTSTTALLRDITAKYVELKDQQAASAAALWDIISLPVEDFRVAKEISQQQSDVALEHIITLVKRGYKIYFIKGESVSTKQTDGAEFRVVVQHDKGFVPSGLSSLITNSQFLSVIELEKGNA